MIATTFHHRVTASQSAVTNISYTPQPTSKAGRSPSPEPPPTTTTIRIAFQPPLDISPSPKNVLETVTVHSCGLDLVRLRVRVHHLASAVEDWSAARSVAISLRASRETRIEFGNEGDGNVEENRGPEHVNCGEESVPEMERARVCFFGAAGPESDLFALVPRKNPKREKRPCVHAGGLRRREGGSDTHPFVPIRAHFNPNPPPTALGPVPLEEDPLRIFKDHVEGRTPRHARVERCDQEQAEIVARVDH